VWNRELIHLLAVDVQPQILSITVMVIPDNMKILGYIHRCIERKLIRKRQTFKKHIFSHPAPETVIERIKRLNPVVAGEQQEDRRRNRRNGVSYFLLPLISPS